MSANNHKLLLFTNDNYRDIVFKRSCKLNISSIESAQDILEDCDGTK